MKDKKTFNYRIFKNLSDNVTLFIYFLRATTKIKMMIFTKANKLMPEKIMINFIRNFNDAIDFYVSTHNFVSFTASSLFYFDFSIRKSV